MIHDQMSVYKAQVLDYIYLNSTQLRQYFFFTIPCIIFSGWIVTGNGTGYDGWIGERKLPRLYHYQYYLTFPLFDDKKNLNRCQIVFCSNFLQTIYTFFVQKCTMSFVYVYYVRRNIFIFIKTCSTCIFHNSYETVN